MLRLYAVRTNGQKIFIDVKEPDVFFDIKLKDLSLIDSYLEEFKPASYETIKCQPFDSPYKHDFLRLYFENHNVRRKALQEIKNRSDELNNRLQEINDQKKKSYRVKTDINKLETEELKVRQSIEEFWDRYDTYSDDLSCYYRKVAREHDFELVGWYRLLAGTLTSQMVVNFSDIESVDSTEVPKLFLLSWDIECISTRGPGNFPVPEEDNDYIYMIQLDIFLLNQSKPLRRYNLSLFDINPTLFFSLYSDQVSCDSDTFIFLKLNSQEELLLKFAELYGLCQPEFEIGYNTSGFDWRFVLNKSKHLGIHERFTETILGQKSKFYANIRETDIRVMDINLDDKMQKYQFAGLNLSNREIKVNPLERQKCEYFYIQGTVNIDLLVWAKKTFQTEIKHTLAHVLEKCRLGGKIDLPYIPEESSDDTRSMFVYVISILFRDDQSLISNLSAKLSKLCKIPEERCLASFNVDTSTLERYAVDVAFYCSVDSLRLQELMIRRNIIGDYIQIAKLSCLTISNIFTNAVGTVVTNFYGRYASRHHMLMSMTRKGIIEISDKYEGALVLEVNNQYPNKTSLLDEFQPVADLDVASFYPSAIIQNNISNDTCVPIDSTDSSLIVVTDRERVYGKFLPHYDQESKMGLMALMCKRLLEERSEVKKKIKQYKQDPILLPYYTALSNALKLIANSIYGTSGYPYSPIYNKYVAPSVTAFCRSTLRQTIDYVRNQGFHVVYGDTDSFFFTLPKSRLDELTSEFESLSQRLEEKIKQTLIASEQLEQSVNDHLRQCGKHYITFVYEKILCPARFFKKKHYCGIIHERAPSFESPKLYLKGLKLIKRSASKFYKTIGEEMIWSILGFDSNHLIMSNFRDPKQVIIDILIRYIQTPQRDLNLFVLNGKYDPMYAPLSVLDYWNNRHVTIKKGNKMVIDFVAKRELEKKSTDPGRFYYYVLEHPDLKARMWHKMCMVSEYDPLRQKIDLLYYFKTLKDLCAGIFACDVFEAERIIVSLYREISNKFKQSKLNRDLTLHVDSIPFQVSDIFPEKRKSSSSQASTSKRSRIDYYFSPLSKDK